MQQAEQVYERQIAGKDQFGHVKLFLEPSERGAGFIFENKVADSVIPAQFIGDIESGIRDSMEAGVIAGYKMEDIKAVLIGGSFNENKSIDVAYRIAANQAFREAVRNASPLLMEPLMKLEVVTPDEYTGDIINDLNSRRGKIENIDMRGQLKIIDGVVPLSEVFGYATSIRSMSQGRASHTLQFSQYEIVPQNVTENIIARMRGSIYN